MVSITSSRIYDNGIDGVFVHQAARVSLGGNRIEQNKGKGVFISSDSMREVSDTNVIRNNLGGDLIMEPYAEPTEDKKLSASEVLPVIVQAVASGRCTYLRTGPHYYVQKWYHCRTCNLIDNEGCCEVCKDTCHAGHNVDLTDFTTSVFFCDCGASGNCKSVRAAQEPQAD